MPYSITDHKHRYCAWAASRAASTKTCRFNVLQGKSIIEDVGLDKLLQGPHQLPAPNMIDNYHRDWRQTAMTSAAGMKLVGFSHGVAAKLINVYLKGAFVCGGHASDPSVAALHSPIDALLLDALYEANIGQQNEAWAEARRLRWSKLDSDEYERVISAIRTAMSGRPLWEVEEHWRGYQ